MRLPRPAIRLPRKAAGKAANDSARALIGAIGRTAENTAEQSAAAARLARRYPVPEGQAGPPARAGPAAVGLAPMALAGPLAIRPASAAVAKKLRIMASLQSFCRCADSRMNWRSDQGPGDHAGSFGGRPRLRRSGRASLTPRLARPSRSINSIWALTLRSSADAQRCSASYSAGSTRRAKAFSGPRSWFQTSCRRSY